MAQKNVKQPHRTPEREREAAAARAELMRLAEEQGVKPFNFDEALGEGSDGQTQEEIQREVDEFLKWLRETRDLPSTRSIS
jgi:hypothetical protein